jgi:hypothetical protein
MKYRKKPVVIEAFKLGYDSIPDWFMDKVSNKEVSLNLQCGKPPVGGTAAIETLEGVMLAESGDYIIKGIKGELYPCKPDIFEATYEKVE